MPIHTTQTQLNAFRAEVRQFLAQAVPEDIQASVRAHNLVSLEHAKRWQKILHRQGWSAPGWPQEHGGPGWSLAQQAVFREELAACDAPRYENLGIDTIGPTIIRHGTAEQKARFLPRMLSFDDFWAQCYSEPNAGSDLASLRTQARRDGNDYILSGTKIWQSYGHWANWGLVLARTDSTASRKQDGISVLLVDLTAPGVTIRPIKFMHGGVLHVQIFFDDVRVPAGNLLGSENAGWSIAKGLLVIERLFVARVAECRAELATVHRQVEAHGRDADAPLSQDVYVRRLSELEMRYRALEAAWWPAIAAVERGEDPMVEASLLKLQGNEVLQDIHQLQMDLLGYDALVFDPMAVNAAAGKASVVPSHHGNLTMHMWRYRGITLGGGTSEVQRGILAKNIFSGNSELDTPMNIGLNEQQSMLDDGVRRLMSDSYEFEHRQKAMTEGGFGDSAFWRGFGELGLRELLLPERDGGFGGTVTDLLPIMYALGESLVNEPVLWASILPTQLLLDASSFESRTASLQALVQGQFTAFASMDRGAPVTATREGDEWILNGRKKLVLGADVARGLLVSARLEGGGVALFECPVDGNGVIVQPYQLHDSRGAADVLFQKARLPAAAAARVAGPERAQSIIDEAIAFSTIALCAESVGAMRKALALTVEYMRTRKQFGRSLSDYQALQHRVVEHFRNWMHARALVQQAADGWSTASPAERSKRISAAKWMAGKAGRAIALDTLQLHGAVGLQDETAISHYAKRLTANDTLLGDSTFHQQRFQSLSEQPTQQRMAA